MNSEPPAPHSVSIAAFFRRTTAAALVATSLLGLHATARADDAPSPPKKLEAALSTSAAMGRGAAIFGGASFAIRPLPLLSVGAYFDASIAYDPMKDCGDEYCATHQYKVGARARFHALPTFVVDPWLGVGIGERIEVGSETLGILDAEICAGADIRVDRFAFGPFGFVDQPIAEGGASESGWNGALGFGLRTEAAF